MSGSDAAITCIAVVVPAADEVDEIEGCLRALQTAQEHLADVTRGTVTARIVVVLDACTDGTADVVREFARVEAVDVAVRCVGTARAMGVRQVLRTSPTSDGLWLASTDADSRVPRDWLTTMLDLADQGADMVLGTVRPRHGLASRVVTAWHAEHDLNDGHAHVHGANLGIRATTYAAIGGWPPLRTGEDEALVARAVRSGAVVRRTGRAPVVTSTRWPGRAPSGFADHLADLGEGVGA